jgi:hypothetical protein
MGRQGSWPAIPREGKQNPMNSIKRRGLLAAIAAAGTAGSLAVLGIGASGAGAATHPHARPHALHVATATGTAPAPFQDVNSTAAKGWCVGANPCDGNAGLSDYGTIDLVPSGFSGGGFNNYAPATKAAAGTQMAVVTGTSDVNQQEGCPTPGVTEACTGPYYLFDGTGTDSLYKPFTVTDNVYLSPATAGSAGTEIDADSGLNNHTGNFGIDNVVGFCKQSTSTFSITFSHSSPAGCTGSATAGQGWVRIVWVYQNVSGEGFLTENVWETVSGKLTKIATTGPQPIIFPGDNSPEPVSALGGPGYFWYPTENLPGFVPVTNLALQSGVHQQGMAP